MGARVSCARSQAPEDWVEPGRWVPSSEFRTSTSAQVQPSGGGVWEVIRCEGDKLDLSSPRPPLPLRKCKASS